jgi:hypothetical protein
MKPKRKNLQRSTEMTEHEKQVEFFAQAYALLVQRHGLPKAAYDVAPPEVLATAMEDLQNRRRDPETVIAELTEQFVPRSPNSKLKAQSSKGQKPARPHSALRTPHSALESLRLLAAHPDATPALATLAAEEKRALFLHLLRLTAALRAGVDQATLMKWFEV